jgi:thiamine biosynthesis protein ThiI
MREVCIVHYDEVALKGGRRSYYEDRLRLAVQTAARDLGTVALENLYGRFTVRPGKTGASLEALAERIAGVCGVRYVLLGFETPFEYEDLAAASIVALNQAPPGPFAVRAKKADRDFPLGESEIERRLGAHLVASTGRGVDLKRPAATVRVEIVNGRCFVAARRVEGPGGLPYGTTGHGVALVSGGIDSPVAAWMMMGRGLKISVVHFHSAPFTSRASQEKVREVLKALTKRQPTIDAAFVPFAETVQRPIVEKTPSPYRVVLYRRFMLRVAGALAKAAGAECLVTGDALAQVASQTVANLATIEAAAPLPVFRPLIGLGKDRIMAEARAIGTFDFSTQPDEDCCSYLMPRQPATRTTPTELAQIEASLDVDALVAAAVARHERFRVRFDE